MQLEQQNLNRRNFQLGTESLSWLHIQIKLFLMGNLKLSIVSTWKMILPTNSTPAGWKKNLYSDLVLTTLTVPSMKTLFLTYCLFPFMTINVGRTSTRAFLFVDNTRCHQFQTFVTYWLQIWLMNSSQGKKNSLLGLLCWNPSHCFHCSCGLLLSTFQILGS